MQEKIKRFFDIIISSMGLIILSPLFALISLAITLDSKGPVIFKQKRGGKDGAVFTIFKFRTMYNELQYKKRNLLSDEKRLTRAGKFLRMFSLDELPEFWNILKGDMSLVGPRPLMAKYLDRYTPEQSKRHKVKPGLTGWAQINGRNGISWEEKFKNDVWYVINWNLWLDVKIVALTFWKVVKREGISNPGHATMEEFKGGIKVMNGSDRFKDWRYPEVEESKLTKYNWIVQCKDKFKLGYKTDIGIFTFIDAKCGVIIEDFVQIGSHCSLYSTSSIDNKRGQIILKKNCKIGSHSIVMPGVTIGHNSIIGAFSFVNKDIPENVIAKGVPAKVISGIEDIKQLNEESLLVPY